jgi:predicted DNA binding CopG/RHH family protein
MLDSNDALVSQLLNRGLDDNAAFYATNMIYDAYFTMNKDEWLNQENKDYRYNTEKHFKDYWLKYKYLHDSIPVDIKTQIIMGIKNRMYAEGMVLETLTFNEWIKIVEEIV